MEGQQQLQEMIQMIGQGLGQLAQFFGKVDPNAGKAMGEVAQHYGQVIEQVMSGGGQQQGPAPMEQGQGGQPQSQMMRG